MFRKFARIAVVAGVALSGLGVSTPAAAAPDTVYRIESYGWGIVTYKCDGTNTIYTYPNPGPYGVVYDNPGICAY